MKLRLLFLLTLSVLIASACTTASAQADRKPITFPKGDKLMPVGVYYYPEHWSEKQWDRDIKRMAELGFDFTHMAEFAWSRLEPKEGVYDFAWLDRAVDLAARYNLKVIMCTPSAAPPTWLVRLHPELLVVGKNSRPMEVGNRLQGATTHPLYQEYTRKIVKALAKRYGDNKAIIGWQIDNEPHHAGNYDYSEASQTAFQAWVKAKHQNLDSLNKRWGTAFWSQAYTDWNQVRIPNEQQGDVNPHQLLDYQLFTADDVAGFINMQADILKTNTNGQFITTNYAYYKFLPEVNPFLTRKHLDFSSYTMYLLSTYLETEGGKEAHRLGSGLEIAFSSELSRSTNGSTGIMELQPGQINWGSYNSIPKPGAINMWMWHNYGIGADFICTYRYRQPLYGGELYHHGIVQTDGVTPSRGGAEYVETIKQFAAAKVRSVAGLQRPEKHALRTAILWRHANLLNQKVMPWNQNWNYFDRLYNAYRAAKSAGAAVTFVQPGEALDPAQHPFLLIPSMEMATPVEVAQWKEYARKGGHIWVSCRTAQKNLDGHLYQTHFGEALRPLTGLITEEIDHMPPNQDATATINQTPYKWNVWAEIVRPAPELKDSLVQLGTYSSEFYAGKAASYRRQIGKGSVTYLGFATQTGGAERESIFSMYAFGKVKPEGLPPYVFHEQRDGLDVFVNYSSQPFTLPYSVAERILGTGNQIAPGEVAVFAQGKK